MLNKNYFAIALLISAVAGCASPIPLKLSGYTPISSEVKIHSRYSIVSEITDEDTKRSGNPYAENIQITNVTQPTFPSQLESDLSRLFEQKFSDGRSDRMVTVRIDEASIYYKQNPAEALPFIGLATAARQRTVVAKVKLFLEFEENGLVQRSTTFEDSAEIQHSIATNADMSAAISEVIQKFREEALARFSTDVLDRYTWPN